jgi:hypothetical protein
LPKAATRTVDFLIDLNQRILARTAYIVRLEPGVWDPERTLGEGRGSCRDSAWLLVQGAAAPGPRGAVLLRLPDPARRRPEAGGGAGRADLRLSPTCMPGPSLPPRGRLGRAGPHLGLMTGEGHIPLAATPEPQSAAPISGLVEEAKVEFGFEMECAGWRSRRASPSPTLRRSGPRYAPWAAGWTPLSTRSS